MIRIDSEKRSKYILRVLASLVLLPDTLDSCVGRWRIKLPELGGMVPVSGCGIRIFRDNKETEQREKGRHLSLHESLAALHPIGESIGMK